eukprot:1161257-Pelagomonas_calceolata.AAC.4
MRRGCTEAVHPAWVAEPLEERTHAAHCMQLPIKLHKTDPRMCVVAHDKGSICSCTSSLLTSGGAWSVRMSAVRRGKKVGKCAAKVASSNVDSARSAAATCHFARPKHPPRKFIEEDEKLPQKEELSLRNSPRDEVRVGKDRQATTNTDTSTNTYNGTGKACAKQRPMAVNKSNEDMHHPPGAPRSPEGCILHGGCSHEHWHTKAGSPHHNAAVVWCAPLQALGDPIMQKEKQSVMSTCTPKLVCPTTVLRLSGAHP